MLPIHCRASEHDGGWTYDDSFFSPSCASEDSGQARQGLLCTGHGPRRARSLHRTRRTIHLAFCGYASFASKTPNHEIQAVDAKRPGALVGRAVPWYRDIHALVCARFIPQVARVAQIHGKILEIHTALAAHYFEPRCSGQFSPIGNGVDSRRQSRTTDSFDASDTHVYWLSTIRERGTFRRTLNGIVRGASESAKSPSYLSFRGWSCSCGVSRWQSVIAAEFNYRLTDTSTRWEI